MAIKKSPMKKQLKTKKEVKEGAEESSQLVMAAKDMKLINPL